MKAVLLNGLVFMEVKVPYPMRTSSLILCFSITLEVLVFLYVPKTAKQSSEKTFSSCNHRSVVEMMIFSERTII